MDEKPKTNGEILKEMIEADEAFHRGQGTPPCPVTAQMKALLEEAEKESPKESPPP